jgi:hypothetical protein
MQLGLSLERLYRLKYWPNLARTPVSDADIPLANLWIENVNSIMSLSQRCNQPLEKARAFAACCYNSGLLEEVYDPSRPAETKHSAHAPQRHRVKQVLTMLLGKLAA